MTGQQSMKHPAIQHVCLQAQSGLPAGGIDESDDDALSLTTSQSQRHRGDATQAL